MTTYTGQQFGNYRLLKLLGEGGFAEVYLGEHIYLGIPAAIKVLTTKLAEDEIDQFRDEARTMIGLKHSNVMRVLDFGLAGRIPFIVMDYASGGSLRTIHPRGTRLPLPAIVNYVKQVAAALQYVHNQRLIHRDVKPENMLLGPQNEVILSDFGITTVAHSTRSLVTRDGSGTIYYMSPEQIQGKPRLASDQYSLGVVVYEWLCGQRPFNGTYWEIASQHLSTPPPSLQKKQPAIPSRVEQVVLKALAKDPKQRFPSVQAFAEALEKASIKPPLGTKLYTYRSLNGFALAIAWSPDSNMIALANAPTSMIEVWEPFKGNRPIASHEGMGTSVTWSPSGTYIALGDDGNSERSQDPGDAFLAIAATYVWNPITKETISIHRSSVLGGMCYDVAWSPDSSHLAMSGSWSHTEGFIEVWDVSSGNIAFSYNQLHGCVKSLAWLRHGTFVASAGEDTKVRIWNVRSGRTLLTYEGHSSPVNDIAISLDNHYAASASADGTIHVWDTVTGQPILIYRGHAESVESVAWSPDSRVIASGSKDKSVHIWNISNGNRLFSYSGHVDRVSAVSWSPNGELIASASQDQTVQIWQAPQLA